MIFYLIFKFIFPGFLDQVNDSDNSGEIKIILIINLIELLVILE